MMRFAAAYLSSIATIIYSIHHIIKCYGYNGNLTYLQFVVYSIISILDDEEMIKPNKKVTEMDKIFYDMIENLDEEKQEIAEKYISVLNDRFAYKIQYFYMTGFKNCLKFLFCIGMFSYEEGLLDE